MTIYFIRHGESTFNYEHRRQHSEVPLSALGREQARAVAKHLTEFPIETLLASPYLRTKETASEISTVIQKEVIYNDLFRERKGPSEFDGTLSTDVRWKSVETLIKEHSHDPMWHYADEENFYDLKKRAEKAVLFLEKQTGEHIAVVVHGVMLRAIIGVMLFGDTLDHELFADLDRFIKTKNTGVTICRTNVNKQWEMITWNEYCHLR